MKSKLRLTLSALVGALLLLAAYTATTHAQTRTTANRPAAKKASPQASGATTIIIGSGTPGQLVKWTSATSVGDAGVSEDGSGRIGIGTTAPTSKLTVQGMIETTLGGLKFPDGTVQTTAFNASQFVRSLNGLQGNVTFAGGANITITPNGNTLTIATTNVLTSVAHDATLKSDGTAATPLGLRLPLALRGSTNNGAALLDVQTTGETSTGILGRGGDSNGKGGTGLVSFGGNSAQSVGGDAVRVAGGDGVKGGGVGFFGQGGNALNGGFGGNGAFVEGGIGMGTGNKGGVGLSVLHGRGLNGATDGLAGEFFGDVLITGNLSKGGGSFKIDHPLDPENKYLYHSFVESPDMMNIYNGTITTDANGEATVALPEWFEALNQDFRYQLTVIGTFAQAIVAQKVKGNSFVVKTNAPNVEVSWQVTGIRHDAYANKHRIPVEEQKSEEERGLYLHPDAFNQLEEKGIQSARRATLRKD
jgi:hypothetical protein